MAKTIRKKNPLRRKLSFTGSSNFAKTQKTRKTPSSFKRRSPRRSQTPSKPCQQGMFNRDHFAKKTLAPRPQRQVKFGATPSVAPKNFKVPRPFQRQVKFGVSRPVLGKRRLPTPPYAKTLGSPYYTRDLPPLSIPFIKKRRVTQKFEGMLDFLKPLQSAFENSIMSHFNIKNKVRATLALLKIILGIAHMFHKSYKFSWINGVSLTLDLISFLTELFDISDICQSIQDFISKEVKLFLNSNPFEKKESTSPVNLPAQETTSLYLILEATIQLGDAEAFVKTVKTLPPPEKKIWKEKWEKLNGTLSQTTFLSDDLKEVDSKLRIINTGAQPRLEKLDELKRLREHLLQIPLIINYSDISAKQEFLESINKGIADLEESTETTQKEENLYEVMAPSFVLALAEDPSRFFSNPEYQIRTKRETIQALRRWEKNEAADFIEKDTQDKFFFPNADYKDPGKMTFLEVDKRPACITGFCFFKSLSAACTELRIKADPEFKREKEKPLMNSISFMNVDWLFEFIKHHTAIDLKPRLSFSHTGPLDADIVDYYNFTGIDPKEAEIILTTLGIRSHIHYGSWEGKFAEFQGKYVETCTEDLTKSENKSKKLKRTKEIHHLCFIQTPFPHWMSMGEKVVSSQSMQAIDEESGFFDKIDLTFLTENWTKIVTWIIGLGAALLAGKVIKVCSIDSLINNAATLSKSTHQLHGDIGKLESFVQEKILHVETEKAKNTKIYLEYDNRLTVFLNTPTYEFYKYPWKVTEYALAADQTRNALTTISKEYDDVKRVLAGTYTATQKHLQEIRQGLSQRKTRQVPTCVYFYGEPGAGKTEMVKQLSEKIREKRNYPDQCLYSFKPSEHFDPYHQQPIAFLDEAFTKIDLSKDCVVDKFNAIVSSDSVNLAGAAIPYKDAPCSFEYFFLGSNVSPKELKAALPIRREAIPAFFERMLIFEAKYNQGPTELAKPRENRKRLPNVGHISFDMYRYSDTANDKFVLLKEDMTFDEINVKIEELYQTNAKNHAAMQTTQIMQGKANNHFVVNFNGPPHRGKTEVIETLGAFFKAYDFKVFSLKAGETRHEFGTSPVVVKVDDCVKLDANGKVDPKIEEWYMDLYNSMLPNNSIVLVGTNITLKKDRTPSLVSGFAGLISSTIAGVKPPLCKLRKGPFSNVGMYRRMGYCGHFKAADGIEFSAHNVEFETTNAGFREVVLKRSFMNSPELYQHIKTKYEQFLGIYRSFAVVTSSPPAYSPDVTLTVNEHIVKELSSIVSLCKILSAEGSATGNKISITSEFDIATRGIPIDSLIPSFKPEYTAAGAVEIVKHFINILLPKTGTLTIKLIAENLGEVVSIDRTIYDCTGGNTTSPISLKSFDPDTSICKFNVESEEFSVNIIDFATAMERQEVFTNFITLPTCLVTYLKDFVNQINIKCPPIAQKLRQQRKKAILMNLKQDVIRNGKKLWEKCCEHKYWSAFIAFGFSLFAIVAIFKIFRKKKPVYESSSNDIMRFLLTSRHELHCRQLGLENKFDEMARTLQKLKEKDVRAALTDIQLMEAKGKNKARAQFAPRSGKMYRSKTGTIVYTDEFGSVILEYHPINESVTEVNKGKNIAGTYDDYEEVVWKMEGKVILETEAALEKAINLSGKPIVQGAEAYHPDFSPESANPQMQIVNKIKHNGVYVFTIDSSEEVMNMSPSYMPSMFGIGLKGKFLLAPRHAILNRSKTIFVSDARTAATDAAISGNIRMYRAEHIYSFPEEELSLFKIVSKTFPDFADIRPYVATPPADSVTSENVFIATSTGATRHGVAVYKTQGREIAYKGKILKVKSVACVSFGNVKIPISGPGSCGLPYFLDTPHTSKIFCGFHIASNSESMGYEDYSSTFQCIFTDHMATINTEMEKLETKTQKVEGGEDDKWYHPSTQNFLIDAQRLVEKKKAKPLLPEPQSERVKIKGATMTDVSKNFNCPYEPTSFSAAAEEFIPNTQRPTCYDISKLSQEQKDSLVKNSAGVPSAAATQEHKWSDPLPVGEEDAFMEGVARDLAPYYSQFFHNYRTLTTDEVFSGVTDSRDPLYGIKPIETDSYAGLILERNYRIKKKKQLIYTNDDGKRGLYRTPENAEGIAYLKEWVEGAERALSQGKQPVYIYKNCLKVEKLPKKKYHLGRTFTMGCTEGILIERKYLAAYCISHHRNAKSHNRLGISIPDFDFLYQEFQKLGGKGFSGDYSRFDRHQHRKIFLTQLEIYKKAMRANAIDEDLIKKFTLVMMNSFESVHLTLNTVISKKDGLNSGSYPTQNLNSDNNLLYVYCGFKRIALENKIPEKEIPELFFSKTFISTYGDDLLVAVSQSIQSWFNLASLAKYLGRTWGMVLDTADKDGKEYKIKPFEELPFISRTPKKLQLNNGVMKYAGGLKIESISGLCHWTSENSPEQIAMNLSIALTEAAIRGQEDYKRVLQVVKLAFKQVKGLSSLLTLCDRNDIIAQVYNQSYGFPGGWQMRNESLNQIQFEGNTFIQQELIMGNCVTAEDYVSQLNLLWQANRISQPTYCDDGTTCTLSFSVNLTERPIRVSSNVGTKRERKQNAAKLGVESYESAPHMAEGDNEAAGEATREFCKATRTDPPPRKANKKSDIRELVGPFANHLQNCNSAKCSFPVIAWQKKKQPYISFSFQFHNDKQYQYRLSQQKTAYTKALEIVGASSIPLAISHLYVIKIYDYVNGTTSHKWQVHLRPAKIQQLESDVQPTMVPPAAATHAPSVATTSDSGPIPDQVAGLPQQTTNTPSTALLGAGEIGSSQSFNCDVIELNPMTSNVEIPENTGRAFSIEEYLYEMWVPAGDVSFSSSAKKGDILYTQSANPTVGMTAVHTTYAKLHQSAIFATENLYYIVSAQNVAAAVVIGWVPDINKKGITLSQVMATSWKIIDLNGNKVIKTVVRDARKNNFYRDLSDTDSVPGLVMMVLAPLNNMFATSATFSITIQKYVRFSKECRFFNPVTDVAPTPAGELNFFSPDRSQIAVPMTNFTLEPLSLFVGGNIIPKWRDRSRAGNEGLWPFPFSPNGFIPFLSAGTSVESKLIIAGPQTVDGISGDVVQPLAIYIGGSEAKTLKMRTFDEKRTEKFSDKDIGFLNFALTTATTNNGSITQCLMGEASEDVPILEWGGVQVVSNTTRPDEGKSLALQLGIPQLIESVQLAGDTKRFEFVIPGQSGVNQDVQSYYPMMSPGSFNLMRFLDTLPSRGASAISFDISNQSGILASVSYIKKTGFFVNSPKGNLVTGRISPSSLYLNNFGILDMSAISSRDYSYMLDFVSPASETWLADRAHQISLEEDFPTSTFSRVTQNMEAGLIAGAAAQAFSGLAGGVASGIGSYYQYKQWQKEMAQQNDQFYAQQAWQAKQNSGQWQNNLDNSNVQGSWNSMIAQQKSDNSLRNAGLLSPAAVNAQGSGASSNVNPRSNWGTVNVYNNVSNATPRTSSFHASPSTSTPSSSTPKSSFFARSTQTSFNTKNSGVQVSPSSSSMSTQTASSRTGTHRSTASAIRGRPVVNTTNRQVFGGSRTPSSNGNFVIPPPATFRNGNKYY